MNSGQSVSIPWLAPRALIAVLKKHWQDGGDRVLAQRMAGAAFLIRVAGALVVYLSQVLLARWVGGFEFGVYVYVWTWVLLLGDTVHLGLASAAQRFIPEYTQRRAVSLLRGFLLGSRLVVFALATGLAVIGAVVIWCLDARIPRYELIPLYLACATLPFYALSNMLDGIARTYNWIGLALAPPYLMRPLVLVTLMMAAYFGGFAMNAATAMIAAVAATWVTAVFQLFALNRRLNRQVQPGIRSFDFKDWFSTSLPILVVWGFYTLLTYADVLLLQLFRAPEEVAHYYSASKTLAFVAFIYFAVSASVAHKFAEYHFAGDRTRLAEFLGDTIRWTFWPSLAAAAFVLTFGRLFLGLFGDDFVQAYPLMFIMAIGLLARAAVGPAERLLNMLGEQRACALVYVAAFSTNVIGCLVLIPSMGSAGAAISTAGALIVESGLLFWVTRQRLGLHLLVFGRPALSG